MMQVIYMEDGRDYVKDGVLHKGPNNDTVMVESDGQQDDLPPYPPTAIAYLAGGSKKWQMDASGTWEVFG